MNPAFEHIDQTKYLLRKLLESGFLPRQDMSSELRQCEKTANEFGFSAGGDMLKQLCDALGALRAGQGTFGKAALTYSNLVSYYNLVTTMLVKEIIVNKKGT